MHESAVPRFSIVMPTFNRGYVIWKAINSILDQTFQNWELIVIDDGSTDSTQRLLEEYPDDRIRTFRTTNRGPSAARNLGIGHAEGRFIAYLDSDNTWSADFLATFDAEIREHPDNVVWYCGQETTIYGRAHDGVWEVARKSSDRRSQYSLEDIWNLGSPDASALVHLRSAGQYVGGWDEDCRWLEDWDFFLRICLNHSGQWHHITGTLLNYRQVHGPGTDSICGKARQNPDLERTYRRYLIEKWKDERSSIANKLRTVTPIPASPNLPWPEQS